MLDLKIIKNPSELVVRDGNDRDNNKKSPWECWKVLHAKNNLAVSVWEAGFFMHVIGPTLMRLAVRAEQRCAASAAPGELDGTAEVLLA